MTSLGLLIGGAAGVVSRITGSVGKGLAAITLDKEYQQKRREEMCRQPKDFGDSLARGGKGFLRVSFLLNLQETLNFCIHFRICTPAACLKLGILLVNKDLLE